MTAVAKMKQAATSTKPIFKAEDFLTTIFNTHKGLPQSTLIKLATDHEKR